MKAIGIVLAISTAFAAEAASHAQPVGETDPLAESVRIVREVGAAMYFWYQRKGVPEAEYGENVVIDLQQIPPIAANDLEALLVPDFLPELPRADAWGNELEFRLAPEKQGIFLMAVRSPGADGRFSGDAYKEAGPFPLSQTAEDLVWIDGYFVRYPGRED